MITNPSDASRCRQSLADRWIAISPTARRQYSRWLAQVAFFLLFVLVPIFDVFRYDLNAGHAWLFGMEWRIGMADFYAGKITAMEAGLHILFYVLLPVIGLGLTLMIVAWRWGRIYCGWLCPHFSVVELINRWMRRTLGRPSLWERKLPAWQADAAGADKALIEPDGSHTPVRASNGVIVVALAMLFAFTWAVVLLTYLLPPAEVYGNLWHATLTRNQSLFIGVATLVLTGEFLFARHLFCRYACAIGLFQSLAWMMNRGGMVVGFERERVSDCARCPSVLGTGQTACETVCPMRLNPRQQKRQMFTCTQCAQCITACGTVQQEVGKPALLHWVSKEAARQQEAQAGLVGGPLRAAPRHAKTPDERSGSVGPQGE